MANCKEATVLLARCHTNKKVYGMRIENRGTATSSNWVGNWAFPIDDTKAKHEKYDQTTISGGVNFDEQEYPGCPYCGGQNLVLCICGKLTCWDKEKPFACAWCGTSGNISGEYKGDLTTDGDI